MICLASILPPGITPQVFVLLIVVFGGMVVNFLAFMVTFLRKMRMEPTGNIDKDEIARLINNRAMRIEFGFFACQLARLIHTFYEVHAPAGINIYTTDNWAVLERSFVTLVLVGLSAYDFIDRHRTGLILRRNGWKWQAE